MERVEREKGIKGEKRGEKDKKEEKMGEKG